MKRFRKILIRTGGILLGLILVLFLMGYFFEDKLHLMAIRELEKSLHAKIDVEDTHVSFLRSWPDVNVQLEGVSINPIDAPANRQDVIALDAIECEVDFFSFFSDRLEIKSVLLQEPTVHLEVDKAGNWNTGDMFQPPKDQDPEAKKEEMVFDLSGVEVEDGVFQYLNPVRKAEVRLDSIYLDLSGDFSGSRSDFDTDMAFHLTRWKDNGMTWARDRLARLELLVDAQLEGQQVYRIREAEAQVAGVVLNWGGEINRQDNGFDLNLAYNTSRNDFEAFVSLLPGGLLDTGREYEYEGEFKMHGWVKGTSGGGKVPSVYAEYSVENGAFHYVDYDSRLTGIQFGGSCLYEKDNEKGSWLKVDHLKAQLRDRPVQGELTLIDFSRPHLACKVNGQVALEDIREFYPAFADSSQLDGKVDLDLMIDGRIDDFREKRYAQVKAQGVLKMHQVRIADRRIKHPVESLNGQVQVDNSHIQVTKLAGKVGHSDFKVQGLITEYLPWVFGKDARVRGVLELNAQQLDLNDWMLAEEGEAADGSEDRFVFHMPDNVDFDIRARTEVLEVAQLHAEKVTGQVRIHDKRMELERLSMNALEGNMVLTGTVYAPQKDGAVLSMNANTTNININQFFRTFNQLAAFALVEENLYGTFTGDFHIEGELNQYLDLDPNSLISDGNVTLRNGRLKDFEPLEGLAGFVKMEDLRDLPFSDVQTTFHVENGYCYLPGMYVEANKYKLDVSGKHGFDNTLDYRVAVELPRKAARNSTSPEVKGLVDIEPESKARIVVPVRVTGTVDKPKYALDGQFVKNSVREKVDQEKDEVKAAFNEEIAAEFGGTAEEEVDDLIEVEEDPEDSSRVAKVMDKIKNPFKKIRWPKKKKGEEGRDDSGNMTEIKLPE